MSVLLATKDIALRETVLRISDNYDFSVVIVSSCKEVFEHLMLMTYRFNMAIVDPDLEELDGLDMIELIKINRPKLPLVVASDDWSYESSIRIAKAGVFYRLGKPAEEEIIRQLFEFLKDRS